MNDGLNQKQLGANYRWEYDNAELIKNIKEDINSILENIEKINNQITLIQKKITNVENKFDNEINLLSQQLNDNIDFLQRQINTINNRIGNIVSDISNIQNDINNINTQITDLNNLLSATIQRVSNAENDITDLKNKFAKLTTKINTIENNLTTETQNRLNGDNAINNRLNSIQFLKWLDRIEFGADLSQPQMILGDTDFTVYYSFPEKYQYTNIWVVDMELNQNSQNIYHNISEYGITWNIVGIDADGNTGAFLEVKYNHENNKYRGTTEPLKYYIYMLYTQFRTDAEPDTMPY